MNISITAVYTSTSKKAYENAYGIIEEALRSESLSDDGFASVLVTLNDAVAHLELLSPHRIDDPLTDGTSLDFRKMNIGDRHSFDDPANWLDAVSDSCIGYWLVENKGHTSGLGQTLRRVESRRSSTGG